MATSASLRPNSLGESSPAVVGYGMNRSGRLEKARPHRVEEPGGSIRLELASAFLERRVQAGHRKEPRRPEVHVGFVVNEGMVRRGESHGLVRMGPGSHDHHHDDETVLGIRIGQHQPEMGCADGRAREQQGPSGANEFHRLNRSSLRASPRRRAHPRLPSHPPPTILRQRGCYAPESGPRNPRDRDTQAARG